MVGMEPDRFYGEIVADQRPKRKEAIRRPKAASPV